MQELQHEIANFGKQKDTYLKTAVAKLKAAKAGVEKGRAALKAAQTVHNGALAECETVAGEREGLAQQLATAEAAVSGAPF